MRPATRLAPLVFAALSVWPIAGISSAEEAARRTLPDPIPVDGFQQLLPRGAIAALVDPTFVSAGAAALPDDAWVLGFAAAGEAYAYDLNLLNHHEVVNHSVARQPIAAVW